MPLQISYASVPILEKPKPSPTKFTSVSRTTHTHVHNCTHNVTFLYKLFLGIAIRATSCQAILLLVPQGRGMHADAAIRWLDWGGLIRCSSLPSGDWCWLVTGRSGRPQLWASSQSSVRAAFQEDMGEATEQGSPRTSLCPIQASHKADPDSAGGQVAPPRDGEAADVAQGRGAEMGGARPPRSAAWASSVCETNTDKYTHSWSCLTEPLFLQNFFF